jgi:hypothetical protein
VSLTVTRHPLPSDETATEGAYGTGTSSSSGRTVTGGTLAGRECPLPHAGFGGGPVGLGSPLLPAGQ